MPSVVIMQQDRTSALDDQTQQRIRTISTEPQDSQASVPQTDDLQDRELGSAVMPKFDANGLMIGVAVDARDGDVLMVAFLNAEALAKTRESGFAHFYSRSRGKLWMKGETSGHVLRVQEILVDCDQDAIVMKVVPEGPACHTGVKSCFYRRLEGDKLISLRPE